MNVTGLAGFPYETSLVRTSLGVFWFVSRITSDFHSKLINKYWLDKLTLTWIWLNLKKQRLGIVHMAYCYELTDLITDKGWDAQVQMLGIYTLVQIWGKIPCDRSNCHDCLHRVSLGRKKEVCTVKIPTKHNCLQKI